MMDEKVLLAALGDVLAAFRRRLCGLESHHGCAPAADHGPRSEGPSGAGTHRRRVAPATTNGRRVSMKTLLNVPLTMSIIDVLTLSGACAGLPLRSSAVTRQQQFLACHPDVPASIAEAIRSGHVITGMTVEQVGAIAGNPVAKTTFHHGNVEIRPYRSEMFHQPGHAHEPVSTRIHRRATAGHRTGVNACKRSRMIRNNARLICEPS
jgi:hypothetical protein